VGRARVRLAAHSGTSARSEALRQARWESRGVTGSVEHVPHHALSLQRGASDASRNLDRRTAPGRTTTRSERRDRRRRPLPRPRL